MNEEPIKLLPTPRTVDGQRPRMQESAEGWGRTLGQAIKEETVPSRSDRSSPGSGSSISGSRSPGSSTDGSARPTSSGEGSFASDGQGSLFSGTSESSEDEITLLPTPAAGLHNYEEDPANWQARAERLKEKHNNGNGAGMPLAVAVKLLSESSSSPEGSPAREPAAPESRRGSDIPKPFCGARWPEPLASYDPDSCSWRTWRTSLLSTMEPSGERFSGTWPRSGTTSRGIAYRREPSAPRTSVIGSSPLLPTPGAWLGRRPENAMSDPERRASREHEGLRGKRSVELPDALVDLQRNSLALPALAVSLSNGGATRQPSVAGKQFAGLRLSPWFVEWMIGAPPGWSDPDCPLSATEFRSSWASSSANT